MVIWKRTKPRSWKRKLLDISLFVLGCGYFGVCLYFYLWQERHLLQPQLAPTGMRSSKLAGVSTNMVMKNAGSDGESVAVHYRIYKPVGVLSVGAQKIPAMGA
jgi:hypothetical protein